MGNNLADIAPYLAQTFGTIGQGLSMGNPGLSQAATSVVQSGQQTARNMEYQEALKKQEEAKKKKKRGGLGSTLGSIAGSLIAGPIGAVAGGTIGQSVGEGEFIGVNRMLTEHALPAGVSLGAGKIGQNLMTKLPGGGTGPVNPDSMRYRVGEMLSDPLSNAMLTSALTGTVPVTNLFGQNSEQGNGLTDNLLLPLLLMGGS